MNHPSPALSPHSLFFSPQSTDFNTTLTSLKRANLTIKNRLQSIISDAAFVARVGAAWGLPLIANERCGSWYIPPENKAGSAYFKSTDGHTGEWGFSCRRLNVQVFDLIAGSGGRGCVVVDSTRRGKAMPDALMKTVPIWCAVFNRLLFPDNAEAGELYTPPNCVSRSEHSQIAARLPGFVSDLKALDLDIPSLRAKTKKPLRPIWVTRDSRLPEEKPEYDDFHPVVLCMASKRVVGGEMSESGYIQGAGDDSEGWAFELTPELFWGNKGELLGRGEEELPGLIEEYLERERERVGKCGSEAVGVRPTSWLFLGSWDCLGRVKYDAVITIGRRSGIPDLEISKAKHLHLECRDKKLGSRDLRTQLLLLDGFFSRITTSPRVLVCCSDGKDLSAGVVLALLCLYSDNTGTYTSKQQNSPISKPFIKQRLSWIMTSHPSASPSRTTLQSINDFLLSEREQSIDLPAFMTTPLQTSSSETSSPDTSSCSEKPSQKNPSSEMIFKSLTGPWTLNRSITNFRIDGLAGTVSGTATFTPLTATTYLYREEGVFTSSPGVQMRMNRSWIWRLEKESGISIYFVKSDGETEDYLYNTLGILEDGEDGTVTARAEHPCGEDFYVSDYSFCVDGEGGLERFEVVHVVKGPAKDYVSRTVHVRKMVGGV